MGSEEEHLLNVGWVKNGNRYVDPKSKRSYALAHALIVQQSRDNEATRLLYESNELRMLKEGEEFSKWNMYEHDVDEMFPPDKKKKRRRNEKVK